MRANVWAVGFVGLAALLGCGGSGGSGDGGGGGNSGDLLDAPLQPSPVGLSSVNVFYSGHSLLDEPLQDNTATVAASLGKSHQWNQQIVLGSPIRVRTRGLANLSDAGFPGYREGQNRGQTTNIDVVSELRNPATISGRYSALVLAERHDLAATLQYEDTVRYARHFHDRLIEGNAQGTTYLFHSWLGVRDKNNPSGWIAYEKSAATAWRCTAARINLSLAAEGRSDRVRYLPSGLAMALLIERAIQGGVSDLGGSAGQVVDRLLEDDVHETDLGAYYMSLVTFATLYGTSPAGGWAPSGVSDGLKQTMQTLAWAVAADSLGASDPDLATCRAHMRDNYCGAYNNYVGQPQNTASCQTLFSAASNANPFHYDAPTDAGYWYAAPR